MRDSTALWAHQHAAGTKKNTVHRPWAALGAVLAPKYTDIVDAPGNPIGFTPTGSERSASGPATHLTGARAGELRLSLPIKLMTADTWVQPVEAQEARPMIPPPSNRTAPRDDDRYRHKARNLVERFFNPLKQFRRIATRYEKLALHFAARVTGGLYCTVAEMIVNTAYCLH